jgi:hypothetical protein
MRAAAARAVNFMMPNVVQRFLERCLLFLVKGQIYVQKDMLFCVDEERLDGKNERGSRTGLYTSRTL